MGAQSETPLREQALQRRMRRLGTQPPMPVDGRGLPPAGSAAEWRCGSIEDALEAVPAARRCKVSLLDARDPRVEPIWRGLEAAARPNYFFTWGWISTWLAVLPADALPKLAVVAETEDDHTTIVAACFLGCRRKLRHGVLPVRTMAFNTTGIPQLDELTIEHNQLLALPGRSWSLAELVALLPGEWDELKLPAVDLGRFAPLAADGASGLGDDYELHIDREVASPFVDLARVRAAGDYLSTISSNTRSQIRRARKAVGQPLKLEVASTLAQAIAIYDEMVELHQASWRARGEPGAFADPWFDRFHRQLIRDRFAYGEIELVRLTAGGQTIGCLYNLIGNGRVLFYQSGLATFEDQKIKPGYLCQAAAIEHAAAAGHAIYDFLGGDGRYKAQLATDETRLVWLRVQRKLKRFALENRVRSWKRAYDAWRAA